MRNKAGKTATTVFMTVLVSSFIVMSALISGCGTEEAKVSTTEAPITAETSQKPLTQELVYNMAVRRIGDASLVKTASISGEGNDKVVTFEVIRPSVCHDGAVVGTVATFSQNTMSSLFRYPEVATVVVSLYGTSEDASSFNEVGLKISVDRNIAQTMDWFALNDTNLATKVSTFYIDPRIEANWQVEGGDSTPRSEQTQTTPTT